MICRHCNKSNVSRPRGLCWGCYYAPGVRDLYPSTSKHRNRGEPKQEERDRLRAALEMLAQIRHVSGSAQGTFRFNLRLVDAVLAGADVRDLATVEAIAAGACGKARGG